MANHSGLSSITIDVADIQPPTVKLVINKQEFEAKFPNVESEIIGRFSNPRIEHRFSAVVSFGTMMSIWEISGIGMEPYSLCLSKALWAKKDFEDGKIDEALMFSNNLTGIRTFSDLMQGVKFDFSVDGKPVSFDRFEAVARWYPAETDTVFIKGFLK